jgi:GT2 family glycosyltransferase
LSFAYTCHLTFIRRALVDAVGGARSEYDGSQDYDLALRATERARSIVHIPEVLYHWRASSTSTAGGAAAKPWAFRAGERAVADAIARRGEPGTVESDPRFPGRYHVRREIIGRPKVSVIIPFRDEPSLLARCVESIRLHAGYDEVEYLLVDNGSELPETKALLERLSTSPEISTMSVPGPFNWAAINNTAARAADGEYLLFLNNDIEARRHGWLHAMLGHAQRDGVGAVGARLLYPDGSIQHAGVVLGLGGIAGHVLRGLPGTRPGYNSMAIVTRESSVLTGACLMVSRETFFSVDGFDEKLAVAFNDVDFSLKLGERGLRLIYTPLAELIHFESKSRGHTDDTMESARILGRWGDALRAGDPYLNVHLSHWRYWCPLSTPQEDFRWQTYLERSTSMLEPSSSA